MHNLISIIIPVYNHAGALNQALVSIARQTYEPIEVIIVDDGSKEKLDIPSIKIGVYTKLIRQEHAGAPAARNRGLKEAKGEYVIFWDADVIAEPDMLEKMKHALDTNHHASFAYGNFLYGWKKMPAIAYDADLLKKRNYIHSTSLIRKKDAVQWDESLKRFQDWDLWLTMKEHHKTGVWVDDYLFVVLKHKNGISSWLPSFAYKKPWRYVPGIRGRVKKYEAARAVLKKKHHL